MVWLQATSVCDNYRLQHLLNKTISQFFYLILSLFFWVGFVFFFLDEEWLLEHLNIFISAVTGIQHVWSTRWKQFSSCKRSQEARISWIKNKYRMTFCHFEKKTVHSYGTLRLTRDVSDAFQLMCPCVFSFSMHGTWMFLLQRQWEEKYPQLSTV